MQTHTHTHHQHSWQQEPDQGSWFMACRINVRVLDLAPRFSYYPLFCFFSPQSIIQDLKKNFEIVKLITGSLVACHRLAVTAAGTCGLSGSTLVDGRYSYQEVCSINWELIYCPVPGNFITVKFTLVSDKGVTMCRAVVEICTISDLLRIHLWTSLFEHQRSQSDRNQSAACVFVSYLVSMYLRTIARRCGVFNFAL